MNALATDQAKRMARLIHENPNLKNQIKAGLYIGSQQGEHTSPVKLSGQACNIAIVDRGRSGLCSWGGLRKKRKGSGEGKTVFERQYDHA